MLIEFSCANITEFDATTGRNVACGHRLVVPEEKIGQQVECPNCKQPVMVPLDAMPGVQRAPKNKKTRPSVAASKPSTGSPVKPAGKSKRPKSKPAAMKSSADDEFKMEAPLQRPTSDVMSHTFETEDTAARQLVEGNETRCPKCGGLIRDRKCEECRYVVPTFESATSRLEDIDVRLAGFQRWFCEIMSEGVSINLLGMGMHLMAFFAFCLSVAVSVLIFSMPWSLLCAILSIIFASFYVGMVYKGYQFTRVPGAKLAWFQKPIWNAILMLARMMNWQNYDSRFKGRGIIDQRGIPLSDTELPAVPNLNRAQVLDLEGTLITDRGLRALYGLQHLHCLVVKKTGVSHEGVFRLQQANPKVWIWY